MDQLEAIYRWDFGAFDWLLRTIGFKSCRKFLFFFMATKVVASSSRWERSRRSKPKGKRKVAQAGGRKKRRKRKVNMSGLKGHAKFVCRCQNGCVCAKVSPVVNISVAVQTESRAEPAVKNTRTVGTEIQEHSNMLPKAGSYTAGDKKKEQAFDALKRMRLVVRKNIHFTPIMVVLLLRVLFTLMSKFNWGWTSAVGMASELFHVRTNTVFTLGKNYLKSDVNWPAELPRKISGRGSAKFKENYGADFYSKLKEVSFIYKLGVEFYILAGG